MKVLRLIGCAPVWMAAVLCAAWAFGALYFDLLGFNKPAAALFVLIVFMAAIFVRGKKAEACDRLWRIRVCCAVVADVGAEQRSRVAVGCCTDGLGRD